MIHLTLTEEEMGALLLAVAYYGSYMEMDTQLMTRERELTDDERIYRQSGVSMEKKVLEQAGLHPEFFKDMRIESRRSQMVKV